MTLLGYKLGVRAIVLTAIGLMLIVALLFGTGQCSKRKSLEAQSRVDKAQTGAVIESGMDASNVQAGIAANDTATADIGRQNEKEIRDAKGSDAAIDPDAHAAGLRALCRRAAYRNRPECRLQ
jgi:hypothetical protein